MDRSILPIPDKVYDGPVYDDAKDPRAVFEPDRARCARRRVHRTSW